jgi:23S rRNA (guanosine2251-2'-O)-methyltransferase
MKRIYGRKPVLEAIISGKNIDRIVLSFGQKGDAIEKILSACKKHKIKLSQVSPKKFHEYEKGSNTQGVIAYLNDQNYFSLEKIISLSSEKKLPLLLILDSIQDPQNLGAILRTAESAGVDGVLITERNSASINETVEKTSAGAVSHLKICKVNNLKNDLVKLKEAGYWIVGSSLKSDKDYSEVDYKMPVAVIVGNEEKGMRRLTEEYCDFLVKIPMRGKIQSLNVSVSAGILMYEILRQRA